MIAQHPAPRLKPFFIPHPLEAQARLALAGEATDGTVNRVVEGQDTLLIFPIETRHGTLCAIRRNLFNEGWDLDYRFTHGPSLIVRSAAPTPDREVA